jgi:hypothetical protein
LSTKGKARYPVSSVTWSWPALLDPVKETQRSPSEEGSRLIATEKNPSMENTTTPFKGGNIRAMDDGKV